MNQTSKVKFDLEERTAKFGEKVISLSMQVSKNSFLAPLGNQLMRSGTSVGANYCEANGASSKKDFKNKIHLCKKEAQETKYWLRMIGSTNSAFAHECRLLWIEADELTRIFATIAVNSK